MITEQQYVVLSLELHMFFGRIMKEHAIFLEAGFTPANAEFERTADHYKTQFETVLYNAVHLGNGMIRPDVVSSGEIVTDYTLGTEEKTQHATGIVINREITRLESRLYGNVSPQITPVLMQQVKHLNMHTRPLLDGLIDFKTNVLDHVLSCKLFTANYPLLIEHIRREATMYRSHLIALESGQNPNDTLKETELFWDQIMMEHALFIRGLLDPTENELIHVSDAFAHEYAGLIEEARVATEVTIHSVTDKTLQETIKYRDFKEAGTKGIAACKIRSIILPLLADHVLRESNHYIRLLRQST
ncbi:MAG: DUF2935 domain-containing protein [Oscillospiraceae bacterium]|nr:DUF2935 domain-containing protein [Oscillospiraceae bacterium]